MKRTRNHLMLGAVCLSIAVVAAGCSGSGNEGEEGEKVPVEVAVAQRQTIDRSLSYDGDVRGELEIEVYSKVPDRIEKIMVDVGDRVGQGAVLARVRATTIEQALRQAEAALVAARAQEANVRLDYERSKRLFNEKALSQQQLDGISTQLEAVAAQREQAEAMVKTATSQLHDAQITAPIAGIVAARNCEEGDMASPAQPLFMIVRMNRVKVSFDVSESEIGLLKTGQSAEVRVKSYPDRVFRGRIAEISPVLDRMTRMGRVEAALDNPGQFLKPGMFARVEVHVGTLDSVIVVPRYATIERSSLEQQSGKGVVVKTFTLYVVKDNRAWQRKLGVSYINHEFIALSDGLADGEEYVTVGQNSLRDSVRVEVTRREGSHQ
jgi:membrane fusion protein (multidrug efflux system)